MKWLCFVAKKITRSVVFAVYFMNTSFYTETMHFGYIHVQFAWISWNYFPKDWYLAVNQRNGMGWACPLKSRDRESLQH